MKFAAKILLVMVALIFLPTAIAACPQCRAAVNSKIEQSDFVGSLFVLALPLLILGSIGVGVFYADGLKKKLQKNVFNGKK